MPSIHKGIRYIKRKLGHIPFDVFIAVVICLVGFGAFALGWIARSQYTTQPIQTSRVEFPHDSSVEILVGSENSDKFHYRWCSGAQRINPDNLVYFESRESAINKGYTPAQNCPGL